MRLERILCAVDFADEGNPSIEYAKELARISGASILVAHVVVMRDMYERMNLPKDEAEGFMVGVLNNAREHMKHFVERYLPGLPVETAILESVQPADALLKLADERDVDLIVLATNGRNVFD